MTTTIDPAGPILTEPDALDRAIAAMAGERGQTPYQRSARRYLDAGWSPIPMTAGDAKTAKGRPHHGVTGYHGVVVDETIIESALSNEVATGWPNVSARMVGSVGIDVDDYEGRGGHDTYQRAQAKVGILPQTYYSTARGAGTSGIRIFRLPAGMTTGILPEGANIHTVGPGIEVIRFEGRYVKAWPTPHPGTGTLYRWYHEDGRELPEDFIPDLADCPELPADWFEFMTADQRPVPERPEHTGGPAGPGLEADGSYTGGSANGGHIGEFIPKGQREITITAFAAHLVGKGFDRETCERLLWARAGDCEHGWPYEDSVLTDRLDSAEETYGTEGRTWRQQQASAIEKGRASLAESEAWRADRTAAIEKSRASKAARDAADWAHGLPVRGAVNTGGITGPSVRQDGLTATPGGTATDGSDECECGYVTNGACTDECECDCVVNDECSRMHFMTTGTQPKGALLPVWTYLATDTDARVGNGVRAETFKVYGIVDEWTEFELNTAAGIGRLARWITDEQDWLLLGDDAPGDLGPVVGPVIGLREVTEVCDRYATTMLAWSRCRRSAIAKLTPVNTGPAAPVWFGPDGLLAEDCAEHVLLAQPCARTRAGKVATYRNGVYGIDGSALGIVTTGMLGNRWKPDHHNTIEAFAAIKLAERGIELPDTLDEPLLNFTNGLLDLRTLQMRDHTPEVMTTWQLGFPWDPDATCPTYLWWVEQVGIVQVLQDLEETTGTMLDRSRVPTKALFLFGLSRSGKSTYLRLMEAVAGRRHTSGVSLHALCSDGFASANLFGKVLNSCADLSANDVDDISTFKKMTGDDLITANPKYGRQFEFRNTALFGFSANKPPAVPETSKAYTERIKPFEFGNSFAGAEDPSIEAKMMTELPGIVARWAKAYNERLTRGRPLPTDPATAAKFAEASSRVARWLALRVTAGEPGAFSTTTQLHDDYDKWCTAERGAKPEGRTNFGAKLPSAGLREARHGITRAQGWNARINPFAE